MDQITETRIYNAVKINDVQTLQRLLPNPVGYQLNGKPIFSWAVTKGDFDVIRFLIDSGCNYREIDTKGYSAWSRLLRGVPKCAHQFHDPTCESCKTKSKRLCILEILLAAYSDDTEALRNDVFFSNADKYKMTPFMWACHSGCDKIIMRLLSILGNQWISMEKFISSSETNVFHHLLNDPVSSMSPARLDTIRAAMAKIPFADRLIAAKKKKEAPLYSFLSANRQSLNNDLVIELTKLCLNHNACLSEYDWQFLNWAIAAENIVLIEAFLRAGCRADDFVRGRASLLLDILENHWRNSQSELIRVLELFLAFGVNLQKELQQIDKRSVSLTLWTVDEHGEMRAVDNPILAALRELCLSNKLFSLQRQCRNTIRWHLKGKADEEIRKFTCIPDRIKSYLLLENEQRLLQISE